MCIFFYQISKNLNKICKIFSWKPSLLDKQLSFQKSLLSDAGTGAFKHLVTGWVHLIQQSDVAHLDKPKRTDEEKRQTAYRNTFSRNTRWQTLSSPPAVCNYRTLVSFILTRLESDRLAWSSSATFDVQLLTSHWKHLRCSVSLGLSPKGSFTCFSPSIQTRKPFLIIFYMMQWSVLWQKKIFGSSKTLS